MPTACTRTSTSPGFSSRTGTSSGADASLRDIARRADVGLSTMYRHFPTREALLEALLRTNFDELAAKAAALESAPAFGPAL